MPIPRITLRVYADADAKLADLKTLIESQLPIASKIFDKPSNFVRFNEGGRRHFHFDIRLKANVDAVALRDKIIAALPTIRTYVSGYASYHLCSHLDASVVNCRKEASFREIVI